MIIFVDFDGVLHPEPCFDSHRLFCFLPRLESVLRDFSQANIVISSTWRETRAFDTLRLFFHADLHDRIIGVTPNWKDHTDLMNVIGYQRQTEIEAWLRNSKEPWASWIAIDDKPYLFRPFLPNLIKTESLVGFDKNTEIKLRAFLTTLC